MSQLFQNPAILWFAAGLVLFLAEFLLPGLILAFFAVGAWVTALLYLILNFGFNSQLVVFISTSVLSLVLLRRYMLQNKALFSFSGGQDNELTREFIGYTCTVSEPINPGPEGGRVLFRGTNWKAHANVAVPAGTSVRIVSKDSIVLFVEPIN